MFLEIEELLAAAFISGLFKAVGVIFNIDALNQMHYGEVFLGVILGLTVFRLWDVYYPENPTLAFICGLLTITGFSIYFGM